MGGCEEVSRRLRGGCEEVARKWCGRQHGGSKVAVRWRGFGGAEAARRRGCGEVARRQRGGGDAGEVAVRRQEGSKGRSKVTPISCPMGFLSTALTGSFLSDGRNR